MAALKGVIPAIVGAANAAAGGFKVERSLRFNSADSAYLNRTPSSATNRKTFTLSAWVKAPDVANSQQIILSSSSGSTPYTSIDFRDNNLRIIEWNGSSVTFQVKTNALLRDISAWYHVVFAVDTTQSTAADRVKIYVNGVQETSFATADYPSLNHDTHINNNQLHYIGDNAATSYTGPLDGYLAEINFIDGQALAPTEFGETDDNNNWNPKDTSGLTFGTNGFYLKFADNSSSAALGTDSSGNGNTWTVNNINVAGNGLSTANEGFDVLTYSGTGSTQSITGLNFQPDLVWTAVRDQTGYLKYWQDVVRGSTKTFTTTTAGAESTQSTAITSFDSGGFTVGSNAQVNESGRSMIAWCWKAGGSPSSNSDGSITTSVSVNTTYGFSIVSYVGNATAGATIGHGLGATPKFVIIKSRDSGHDWIVYHSSIGNTAALRLNGTNMSDTNTKWFNDAGPSSSTFTLGYTGGTNENGDNMIAYCWSEISGFSKFGGFTHSGSSSSVTGLGFTPRFVLIKRYSATDSWYIFDSARDTNNVIFANTNAAESSGWAITFNADGFSWAGGSFNTGDHMYAAFAAKPDDSVIDSLIDTPSNYEAGSGNNGGNYATYNPLNLHNTADTVSEGNLKLTSSGSGSSHMGRGTIAMKSGKWYFEVTWVDTQHNFVGIVGQNDKSYNNSYTYLSNAKKTNDNGSSEGSSYGATWGNGDIIGVAFDADNGTLAFYKNGVSQGTAFTGIATDGSAGTYSPYPLGYVAITGNWNNNACTSHINFGQRPFAISSVPAGFKALCTQNLADPLVADGGTAFDVALWTGNGSSQTVSSLNFNPDLIWTKTRSNAVDHKLVDTVRGISEVQETNQARADYTDTNGVTSTSATGFSLGSAGDFNTNGRTYVGWTWDAGTVTNPVGDTWQGGATKYIGVKFSSASGGTVSFGQTTGTTTVEVWSSSDNSNWTQQGGTLTLADGHTLTFTDQYVYIRNTSNATFTDWFAAATDGADGHYSSVTYPSGASWSGPSYTDYDWRDTGGVINEDGSIPSVVRVNTSAGVSIVSYTGTGSSATVGHGLGATPHMYIVKNRDETYEWGVYHRTIGTGAAQVLNAANNNSVSNSWWNNTAPTSSVFNIGTYQAVNNNTKEYIAYVFAPVAGFSAFGVYEGNSSDNGPYLFTGFRVKWLMIKCTNAAGQEWVMLDAVRSSFNVVDDALYANASDAEATGSTRKADFLSNGFKLRDGSSGATNLTGRTYIYAAFAEHPFKTSRAR
mgnify:CR=1 FL=1